MAGRGYGGVGGGVGGEVATSVLEEGLDVPACDVVVRFDSVDSLRAYVQSRGRVRHKVRKEGGTGGDR